MKTLAYDCGNPVIICLRAFARSAFLFTGSPRSARDDKRVSTQSCTLLPPRPNHPRDTSRGARYRATPPMEGNLARTVAEQSSPLWRGAAKRRGGLSPEASAKGGLMQQPKSGKNQIIRRIGRMNAHRTLWGRGVSHIVRRGVGLIRAPLSLRRSTNNVENVGVRLWQSSYNMSAGECPHFLCHSRARGPHEYECICGVDKAGIGLGLLLVI